MSSFECAWTLVSRSLPSSFRPWSLCGDICWSWIYNVSRIFLSNLLSSVIKTIVPPQSNPTLQVLAWSKPLSSPIFCQRLTFCVAGFVLLFSLMSLPHTFATVTGCHVNTTPGWLSGGSVDLLRDVRRDFKISELLNTALYPALFRSFGGKTTLCFGSFLYHLGWN